LKPFTPSLIGFWQGLFRGTKDPEIPLSIQLVHGFVLLACGSTRTGGLARDGADARGRCTGALRRLQNNSMAILNEVSIGPLQFSSDFNMGPYNSVAISIWVLI
jgi:hypothetical protein